MKLDLPKELLWERVDRIGYFKHTYPGNFLCDVFDNIVRNKSYKYNDESKLMILNEVFCQCTRVVYEKKYNADLNEYIRDIKSTVGLMQHTIIVLKMMRILLKLQGDQSLEITNFAGKLAVYATDYYDYMDLFSAAQKSKNHKTFFLTPEPSTPSMLKYMNVIIDWQKVTLGFNKEAINELRGYYGSRNEECEIDFMCTIEYAWRHKRLTFFDETINEVDEEYFNTFRDERFLDENYLHFGSTAHEYVETLKELEEVKKRNDELEKIVNSSKERQENSSDKKEEGRYIPLSIMVEYCKKRVELRQVEGIIVMLNALLRKLNGTDEEYKLVDSIEEEFMNRTYGNTYIKEQTVIPSVGNYKPQITTQNIEASMPSLGQQKKQKELEDEEGRR